MHDPFGSDVMNLEPLTEALRLLENSRVAELELESEEGMRLLRVRRTPGRRLSAAPLPVAEVVEEEPSVPRYERVEAKFVGYFHTRRHPVAVGVTVTEEEILGEIESMRVLNPIVAPIAGRIAAIHVEDGQPVEYGQPLFEIDPAA